MCKCTPNMRTPYCGKVGCEWPKPDDEIDLERETKSYELQLPKEFWFGISEGNKPHVNTKQVWSTDYHVIEYSAYEELKRKLEIAKRALEEIDTECSGDNSRGPSIAWNALEELGE